MSAARGLRALPTHTPRRDDAACTSACVLEQIRRADYLRRVIIDHVDEMAELSRQYEQLADRYNKDRAELNEWRAWSAAMPKGRIRGNDSTY